MKNHKLNTILFLIIIFLIIIIIILGINKLFTKTNSSKKYYSNEAINTLKENNLNNVYEKDYSKTLDEVIKQNKFKEAYLKEYINIEYIEGDNFLEMVNNYLDKNYKSKEINNIFNLSKKNQEKLLNLDKINNLDKYLDIKNFDVLNIDRYEEYQKENSNLELNKVVTYVNINLDKEFYTDSKLIENPNEITTLINKYNHVESTFVPKDLVTLFDSKNGAKMVRSAANAYKEFIDGAKKDNITLESTTAYRSYSFQNTLYTNYVKEDGQTLADTYSARPGSSEHQLGLAVDLNDPNVSGKRLDDKDYEWVLNNSYKYGFIIRYTKESEKITGYMEEPWHIRYLGIDLATKVYKSGLTYDEYYDLYIKEY